MLWYVYACSKKTTCVLYFWKGKLKLEKWPKILHLQLNMFGIEILL